MVITIGTATQIAKEQGYMKLASALEEAQSRLRIKQFKNVQVLEGDGVRETEGKETLYFALRSKEQLDDTVYFSSEEQLYEAAYRMTQILKDEEKLWYEKIIDANLKFNDITLKYPSLGSMIKYFNQLMENPVIVYDEFFNIIAITNPLLSEYDRDETDLKRYELRNLFYYKQRVVFQEESLSPRSCNRLLFPVLLAGMPKGYLAIFDLETPYEEMDKMILEIFANSALTEMRRRLELQDVENKFVSDFIYDVIFRKEAKEEEIQRRAKRLNVAIDAEYCMIAINPIGKMMNSQFDTNGYITKYEFMNDRIMNNIDNFHRKIYEQDIVTKFDTTIYLLHKMGQHDENETYDTLKHDCSRILKKLNELFQGMAFQFGIGDIVKGLKNVSSSFHQAWAALSYGELLEGKNSSFIICYTDNSLLKLFGRLKEIGCLEEMIPENLQRLWEYDQIHHTQFYDTLKMYLQCRCNAKRAAEKLFIHYKTMLYRIEKLKSAFGIDLEDGNGRLFLELGIHLLDMQKKK